jgi:flagellar protein FlgJ
MSTLPLLHSPSQLSNTTQANIDTLAKSDINTPEDTAAVGKKFEALLIHNMLKAMRSTTLGDKPSNERAMYDDMYDQHLSKLLSDSNGLGIAESISRQLNAQLGVDATPAESPIALQKQRMRALSNSADTLASNGHLTSTLKSISHYQEILDHNKLFNELNTISAAKISVNPESMYENKPLSESKEYFINSLMPDAKRSAERLGIAPDVIIAIAALETGWGKHIIKTESGLSSHNLFGIKAHSMSGPYTMHKTTEYINEKPIIVDEPFKRYGDNSAAVRDFADFLLSNPRYKNALEAKKNDHQFLNELQRAGYATDPEYANKAIEVLRQIKSLDQSSKL